MLTLRYKDDTLVECGLDEAGRGCLWGPFYAAAVIWDGGELSKEIKDSKKISAKKRERIYEGIMACGKVGIGVVTAKEIDEWGMTKANRTAFERALAALPVKPARILIDGCLAINTETEQIVEPEMDNKYLCVAAASIVAKVSRDKWVQAYVEAHPILQERYSLNNCKGYGTLKHRNGILEYGKDDLHRNLFLRKLLGSKESKNSNDTTCEFLEEI
jgi:ribonuclease HII